MASRKLSLKVVYSKTALVELREIWTYNLANRDFKSAEKYIDLLRRQISRLSDDYEAGKIIEEFPEFRRITVQKRRPGDGHVVIYEVDLKARRVEVHHLFHTKQDVDGRLREERSE